MQPSETVRRPEVPLSTSFEPKTAVVVVEGTDKRFQLPARFEKLYYDGTSSTEVIVGEGEVEDKLTDIIGLADSAIC